MLTNMLDYLRIVLYLLLAVLGFYLIQAWQKDYAPVAPPTTITQPATADTQFVPQAVPGSAAATQTTSTTNVQSPTTTVATTGKLITVTTDVLQVQINTLGGNIVETKLLKYPESLGSKQPFLLLNNDAQTRYVAQSGLLSKQGPDTSQSQALYTTTESQYTLTPGQKDLVVTLHWQNQDGLTVNKIFTFKPASYEIGVGYQVDNQSTQDWQGNLYTQLLRTDTPPKNGGGMVNLTTYFGAAISTPKQPFDKINFKDMREKDVNVSAPDGWAAMVQHYFISAWVPPQASTSTYYSKVNPGGLYTIGMIGQDMNVAPGKQMTTSAKLYTGPTIGSELEKTAPNLNLTIDYGWFWFISAILFWMLQKLYDVIGNWGWAIVGVTIIIKLLFYHLSAKSYRSMSALKRLQPRIELLKERFGDDRQKLTQATLELYRQEKVNPMSGCLPILVQIPVFIALYWVLVESVQLRQAPFILWIHDLSQADPYYILPLLMGASMFIQQKLNPPPADPTQAKLLLLMPIIFTVLFANFPAGLMLYWFVNNTLSVLQQWHIMYSLGKAEKAKKT